MCPQIVVIAGQNGCGKSTLSQSQNLEIALIDPDAFSPPNKELRQRSRAILRELDALENRQESFALETTLSGKTVLNRLARLKKLDYRISIHFISVQGQAISQARVRQRVALGGHDVPIEDQRRRFLRSFDNLLIASKIAHETTLYDNSTEAGHTKYFYCADDRAYHLTSGAPRWIRKFADIYKSDIYSVPHKAVSPTTR